MSASHTKVRVKIIVSDIDAKFFEIEGIDIGVRVKAGDPRNSRYVRQREVDNRPINLPASHNKEARLQVDS
jgi:hypothetical protein